MAEAFAPAKINLSLHVTGHRSDGYHLLDSLVVFADVGDRLWFEPTAKMSLSVMGPFAQGVPTDAANLVWQAAEKIGFVGDIKLEKNLPHGAGIGGGSADAAAVIRTLGEGHQVALALELGADVPVCLNEIPTYMRGTGETLSAAANVPECHLVLVNPNVPLPTPAVFQALTGKTNPAMTPYTGSQSAAPFLEWLADQRNDLEAPAIALAPVISEVLHALSSSRLARMSGSGSTCFGIYDSAEAALDAANVLRRDHPDWWARAANTLGA